MIDPTSPDDCLLLDAFRYAADEMSEPERTAFETRLGEDQAAREALSRAVQIADAVALPAVTAVDSAPQRVALRPRRHWASAAAASACAAFLVALGLMFSGPGPQPDHELAAEYGATTDLVALWRQGADAGSGDFGDPNVSYSYSADPSGADAELSVPDWMLAAVSIDAPELNGTDPPVREN